jgi:DNA-binding transcriptional ArsR family regulator
VTTVEHVLSALADPTRRDLLELLSVQGHATATTLADGLPISRQAVVQHLAVLDSVGLVSARREGRERRFEVRAEPLGETAVWLNGLAQRWESRLAAIKRISEGSMGATSSDL